MKENSQCVLSILTICYNESDNIRKTIESVIKQSCTNYEYIIKDGKSKDDTNEIIDEYRKEFEKRSIRFVHCIENDNGTYDAMNRGSDFCKGKFICFLNAGDAFNNEYVVETLKKSVGNADVYYGDAVMVDEDSRYVFRADMSLISRRMPFSHQSCFVRLDTFKNIKYNTRYKICADYDMVLRLYEKKVTFQNLNIIVSDYDMSGVSSTAFVKKRREHEAILTEHGLNNCFSYLIHMCEAYLKSFISIIIPNKVSKRLKNFYKKNIKHYKLESECR